MGTGLKILAVLLVVGGIWVWAAGRSEPIEATLSTVPSESLSASVGLIGAAESGRFDQTGTIILDMTQGSSGTAYLLYTDYRESGRPAVKTKRLVFMNGDECATQNLPCATNQPGVPVSADEEVRVIGYVENERVEVAEIYRL